MVGTEGNEILTSFTAALLIGLLAAEGLTILHMNGLLTAHMLIGLILIPVVGLKLGGTGYRFVRYYKRSPAYLRKGPPTLPLRLLAPFFVAATVAVFATGVILLVDGHKAGSVLEIHKVSFIVWGVLFVPHLLVYLPRVLRSLRHDWTPARRKAVPGSGWRATLIALALGSGAALGLALLPTVEAWQA
jgi:hypothetical protein